MLKWGLMRLVALLKGLQVRVAPESTQEVRAEELEGGSPWRGGCCTSLLMAFAVLVAFGAHCGEALGYCPHH